jgi:hypothetical protein
VSEALLLEAATSSTWLRVLLPMPRRSRQDDAGTELRDTLARMHEALTGTGGRVCGPVPTGTRDFTDAVGTDDAGGAGRDRHRA